MGSNPDTTFNRRVGIKNLDMVVVRVDTISHAFSLRHLSLDIYLVITNSPIDSAEQKPEKTLNV